MTAKLDDRSVARLSGVHPVLTRVISEAAGRFSEEHPGLTFFVTEGVRTTERQRELVAKGASRTMNSRHIPGGPDGMGKAVDIAIRLNGELSWDWPLYARAAKIVKRVAAEMKAPVEWGGDWRSFPDGPHFQLSRKVYP
jgi:peptidoglycan LD-endopeptidase CwlK